MNNILQNQNGNEKYCSEQGTYDKRKEKQEGIKLKVGCVKEIKNNEFRVGMTPDNVKVYAEQDMRFISKRARDWAPDLLMLSMKLPEQR